GVSVADAGTGLDYQWYKGNSVMIGQTGSNLNLTNISASDAAIYSVMVSGTCGNPVTNSASLTVNENVAVSVVPVNSTNCPGTAATFTIMASGTGLAYQW